MPRAATDTGSRGRARGCARSRSPRSAPRQARWPSTPRGASQHTNARCRQLDQLSLAARAQDHARDREPVCGNANQCGERDDRRADAICREREKHERRDYRRMKINGAAITSTPMSDARRPFGESRTTHGGASDARTSRDPAGTGGRISRVPRRRSCSAIDPRDQRDPPARAGHLVDELERARGDRRARPTADAPAERSEQGDYPDRGQRDQVDVQQRTPHAHASTRVARRVPKMRRADLAAGSRY